MLAALRGAPSSSQALEDETEGVDADRRRTARGARALYMEKQVNRGGLGPRLGQVQSTSAELQALMAS